jgi:pimeloyl-ACP methyl ester carboxylesterase
MGQHVRAGDLDIWTEQVGQGPDVVLIGGLGDTVESWQFQLDGLADRYRLTAFDDRGAGRTAMPDGPVSAELMADDAAQVLRALEVPSAHVAGFSMGSAIALAPDREAGLSRPAASLIGSRRNSGLRRPGNQSRARGINPAIGCRWAPLRHRPSTDPHKARCRYRFDAGCRHIGHRGGPPGGANGSSAWKPCRSYSGLLRSLVASR